MNQPTGDRSTIFVLHGRRWLPGSRVTVRLAGEPVSPVTPFVDMAGAFNYAVNQQHEFFDGPIPPGTYTLLAIGPGGATAKTRFSVHP
jgi:hypothetical protein